MDKMNRVTFGSNYVPSDGKTKKSQEFHMDSSEPCLGDKPAWGLFKSCPIGPCNGG